MKKFTAAMLCIYLVGCASFPKEEFNSKHKLFSADRSEEVKVLKQPLELGVALSGGGIRSSVFSLGVLKALYDAKILDQVDAYAFASGGGYAGYWLMSTEAHGRFEGDAASANKPFGYYAFDDTRFTVNLCELMTKSNFVNYTHLLGAWIKGKQKPGDTYQEDIERTYGWFYDQPNAVTYSLQPKKISEFKKHIDEGFPYFIYTMTVQKPEAQYGLTDGHFEMTPIHYGNDAFKFKLWTSETEIPISRASSISGAAIASVLRLSILEQPVTVDFEVYIENGAPLCQETRNTVTLSDGGHSENLAILPLLRRNIKTIIAVDAEDDKEQIFEGFYKLKDRLTTWGYTMSEPTLDERKKLNPEDEDDWWKREVVPVLGKSVLTVTVQHKDDAPADQPITIHYIKMNRADKRVYKALFEQWRSPGLKEDYESVEEKTIHANIRVFLENTKRPFGKWECTALASTDYCGVDWAIQDAIIRMANDFDGGFPTHTTIDQSFYIDQTLSYIGLGYLLGSDLGIDGEVQPVPHCGIPENE